MIFENMELSLIVITMLFFSHLCVNGEDFAFEQDKNIPLRRSWGVPDTTVHVGHLFHFKIPLYAFEGNIIRYKAFNEHGGPLPGWLSFDERSGIFEGIPMEEDLGEHYITIKAFDQNLHDSVKDVFALEVLTNQHSRNFISKDTCKSLEDKTVFTIILDVEFPNLSNKMKISILKNFINHFDISPDIVSVEKQFLGEEMVSDSLIEAGPGNIRKRTAKSPTILKWQVGCQGNILHQFHESVEKAKHDAKLGTIAKVLEHPVLGWRIAKDESHFRKRREVYGSGAENVVNDDTFSEEEDSTPDSRVVVTNSATPSFSNILSSSTSILASVSHPHRHHHGDFSKENIISYFTSIAPTPVYIPDRPTSFYSVEKDTQTYSLSFSTVSPSSFDIETSVQDFGTSESEIQTIHLSASEATTPVLEVSTEAEDISYGIKNFKPSLDRRLQKLAITAGKFLRFTVPKDTFSDLEDGETTNLNLSLSDQDDFTLKPTSWVQFDPRNQEIYALPLEEHVSKWMFTLSAMDSGGLSIQDKIEILVQHHKGYRTVTHAFFVELQKVPTEIILDWEVQLLDAVRNVFSDPDTSKITVLNVNVSAHPMTFTWTNDSLPRNSCPRKEIETLHKVLNSETGLKKLLGNGFLIGKVGWIGMGQCEDRVSPPKTTNVSPTTRNQVDHLNASVGQLLIFTVPEDSFYDEEDGNARNLKLSLVMMDRSPIKKNHWLQFDVKNQEFYGVPESHNVGQMEYQLICEDSGGLTAHDVLVVIVHPASKNMYNVEFSMRLGLEFSAFSESPSLKKNFILRLASLFGDTNTNSIVLSGYTPGSTVITWHNKSLPTDFCPDGEIRKLRQIMLGDDERVTPAVGRALGPEFPVLGAWLIPTGLCQGALTEVISTGGDAASDVTAISHSEQYIVVLIVPAIVIAIILLCAGLVACALYRRRRTGKMSVGDEDERQSFRSKGIPVIFQDELDERPEPTNKSPVIMKEEKPPLPPPEYQRGPPLVTTALLSDTEDSLYQPPPPFTSSKDSARPKPTPTYRMPPPYVPP